MGEVLDRIRDAIIEMKIEQASALTKEALKEGLSAIEILNQGLILGLKVVGERFRRDEIFLPEVMLSARAFKAGFELLKPKLLEGNYQPRAKVVLGTVAGDVHDIGKNIVASLLEGNGYQVIDLGVNVSKESFVQAVEKHKPEVLGMSTLLTTTMPEMERVILELKNKALRDKIKVIIGGAPVSQEYAEKIQADGYGEDAQQGVEIINKWIEERGSSNE